MKTKLLAFISLYCSDFWLADNHYTCCKTMTKFIKKKFINLDLIFFVECSMQLLT